MKYSKKEKIIYLSCPINNNIKTEELNNLVKEYYGELSYDWEYSEEVKYIIIFFEKNKELNKFINNFNKQYTLTKFCPF